MSAFILLLFALFPIGTITSSQGHIPAFPRSYLPLSGNDRTRETANIDMQRIAIAIRGEATNAGPSNGNVNVQCSGRDDSLALKAAIASANDQRIVINNSQTCAASDIAIPNLKIEKGGLLKPVTGHTVTLTNLDAGNHQIFTNALAGQGTVAFSLTAPTLNALWWGPNTTPGTTDMTAALQATINATSGRGKVFFPQTTYLITETLTVPLYSGRSPAQSLVVLEGEGPFLSNLVNKASAGKPTLLLNRDLINVYRLGFWGMNGFPNDGIKISLAGRLHIENCELFVNGNGIFLEKAQSVWIQNNYGSVSSGSGIIPPPAGGWRFGPTNSFVYVDIPASGYANHIIIRDNMNEGYPYKVYTNQSGDGAGFNFTIDGNQFEGGPQGIYLKGVANFSITDNYIGEGSTGYSIELNDCRYGQVGPNYLHFTSYTAKNSTVKLTNVLFTHLTGGFTTAWLIGYSNGLVFSGGQIARLIDETSDKLYGVFNIGSALSTPQFNYHITTGRSEWRSDSTSIIAYPGARLGDKIWKKTPAPGASPGWICTSAGSTGALAQITGSGPDPVVLPDYYQATAYDFRVTIITGGAVGTAVYKVAYKTAGGGSYTDLATKVTTAEVPRVIDEVLGGAFTIKWPAATYVSGDQWTFTSTAPTWTPLPNLP